MNTKKRIFCSRARALLRRETDGASQKMRGMEQELKVGLGLYGRLPCVIEQMDNATILRTFDDLEDCLAYYKAQYGRTLDPEKKAALLRALRAEMQ